MRTIASLEQERLLRSLLWFQCIRWLICSYIKSPDGAHVAVQRCKIKVEISIQKKYEIGSGERGLNIRRGEDSFRILLRAKIRSYAGTVYAGRG